MGTAYVEKTTTSSSSEPTSPGYIVEIVKCSVLNVRSGAGNQLFHCHKPLKLENFILL